ncbi:NMDA receptor-regulated protein 1-domain-containing protein [Pisolithus albus]|nr:NMDA receptor-regulated protein 1-domain-containing protein [Pisolithus albus]
MSSQQATLAQKDRKAFQDLLSCYELKQLTKGRKVADQLLKKYPDHGETMCMKGLILVHLGQREEGIKLIREGMRKDLTSHICWHVWALVQKGEHKYEEALKSYMQALRFDKDNFNIVRETSVLQTQTRAYESLVESRLHMLRLRPSFRAHWVGLAVAYQLSGNLVEAKRVLEHFQGLLRECPVNDAEYSEFLLFHVHVLEDLGHLQDALAFLDKKSKDRYIVDRTATHTFRARILSKLMNTNKESPQVAEWSTRAESEWRALLDLNPECSDYYQAVLANQGIDLGDLDEDSCTKALALLSEFSVHFPKAYAPRQLALTVAQGDRFRGLAKPYIEVALSKGIPSLFSNVKKLYADPVKCQVIEEIVEDIPSQSEPAKYLWTLYFLAQHYSFLGRHRRALEILNLAVEHTPTLPELYMTKAKVLKRAGDPYGAVRSMDEARKLDGQDRFINTKSGKYRLRAGMIDEAEEIFGLFTRKGAATPGADLTEMQALHYLVEVGDAYRRIGKLNLALKKYYTIQKVFEAFREDQYDFHQYSIRKTILLPYFDMLKWEDEVQSHPVYVHAVVSATRVGLPLCENHRHCSLTRRTETTDASKKALSKAKKAAHKGNDPSQESQDAANKKVSNQSEDKGLDAPIPKDEDPDGVKMVLADDALERAAKFLATLKESGKRNIDACLANFDVAMRRKKYLQAARALTHAHAMDAQHPQLHLRVVQFGKTVSSVSDSITAPVKSVLHETLIALKPEEISLDVFTSQYLQSHSTSPSAILACAEACEFLGNPTEDVESLLFTVLKDDIRLSVEDALHILSYLQRVKSTRAEEFRIACDNKFELSTVFKSSEEQTALRRQCLLEEKEDCDDVENL